MGFWGYGNFDGDSPRDYLADMVSVWERIIDHTLAGEMKEMAAYFGPEARPLSERGQDAIDTVVMPTAEVMIAVAKTFECDYLPSPEKVSGWAAEALGVFDAEGGAVWDGAPERRTSYRGGIRQAIADRRAARGRRATIGVGSARVPRNG